MLRAALIVALAAGALAACTPPTHVDGHKIRATAAAADALHEGAPAWFTAWWGDYLHRARGGHAVLALDRNGRGGWYVYCGTGGCHLLDDIWAGPIKDVHYEHRALKLCRAGVAKAHPAARPAPSTRSRTRSSGRARCRGRVRRVPPSAAWRSARRPT